MPLSMTHLCEKCHGHTDLHYVEEYDEYWCDNCLQNKAEAAYERLCEDFHDGGSTAFDFVEKRPRKGDLP